MTVDIAATDAQVRIGRTNSISELAIHFFAALTSTLQQPRGK
jgi:hypothetical protein